MATDKQTNLQTDAPSLNSYLDNVMHSENLPPPRPSLSPGLTCLACGHSALSRVVPTLPGGQGQTRSDTQHPRAPLSLYTDFPRALFSGSPRQPDAALILNRRRWQRVEAGGGGGRWAVRGRGRVLWALGGGGRWEAGAAEVGLGGGGG